jgi:hypothetical protein
MPPIIREFPAEDYPTRELLEPLMVEAGFGKLPDVWLGSSTAMFLPELIIEIMKRDGNTDILYKNEVTIEDNNFRDIKFTFYFYTRWAGVDNKVQSLVFRLISLIKNQPKYLVEGELYSLTIEEKYYYAILVRTMFDERTTITGGVYAPVFTMLYMLWQERYGKDSIPTIKAVENMLQYNDELFDGIYKVEEVETEEYEIGIALTFDMVVEDILYIWSLGVPPSRIKLMIEMDIPLEHMVETSDNMPDEWYKILA